MFDGSDNTDNRHKDAVAATFNSSANRISVGKISARERFIYDRNRRRIVGVCFQKIASLEKWDTQRVKGVRRHDLVFSLFSFSGSSCWTLLSFDDEVIFVPIAGK